MASSKKKSKVALDELVNENEEAGTNGYHDEIEDKFGAEIDSDEYSDESSEEEDNGTFDLDFEALSPEETDFHGIKQLLLQLFLKGAVDTSALTDLLIKQQEVGSVIKQCLPEEESKDDESEEDYDLACGIISCLNLTQNTANPAVDQVISYLVDKAGSDDDTGRRLRTLITNPEHRVGWLINERFLNIPPHIAVPSFNSLRQEMEEACVAGKAYNFTHFLIICKKFRLKGGVGSKRRVKRPRDTIIFSNGEEEYFAKNAEFSFSFSVAKERDTGATDGWSAEEEDQYEPTREVVVFKSELLPPILLSITQALQTAMASKS